MGEEVHFSRPMAIQRSKDLSTPQGVDPVGGELVNPVARPQGVEKQIIIGIWGKYYSLQRYHNNYRVKEMRLMKLIVVKSSSHKDEASTQLVPAMPFVPTGRGVNENQMVRT